MERNTMDLSTSDKVIVDGPELFDKGENGFSFQSGRSAKEDDEVVTESKIRAFLDEKVILLLMLFSFCLLLYNIIVK